MSEIAGESFGQSLRRFRAKAGLSQPQLARKVPISQSSLSRYESGKQAADPATVALLDELLTARGALLNRATGNPAPDLTSASRDEITAFELLRRAEASDVGDETLSRLEAIVDDMACRYPVTRPEVLLEDVRLYLSYLAGLMDKRMKLSEHRRLLIVGGWLSLLSATVHIDLKRDGVACENLRTASSLARHAEHSEIHAWCLETEAWRVLSNGNYPRALELSRAAQSLAPSGSSVAVQSVAQEGRALARMGRINEMRDAIDRAQKLVSPMKRPDRPEHHYRYDPDKSVAYVATTLAWAGDPAGEEYAREVLARLNVTARLKPSEDIGKWPRRVASANLDLALTLIASRRFEEAIEAAKKAILSGRVVPSNRWRALEVVRSLEGLETGGARELREAYNDTFE